MIQDEKLEIEEGQQAVSKWYYFSKYLVIVVISLFITTIVGLIIGISVIGSSRALQTAESQKTTTTSTTVPATIQTSTTTTTMGTTKTTSTTTTTTTTTSNNFILIKISIKVAVAF